MNEGSIDNVRNVELFLVKLRKATTDEAIAALFDDPSTEASVFSGTAQYLVFAANLNHRNEGHAAPASEDCEVKKCCERHKAARHFIAEAERKERQA